MTSQVSANAYDCLLSILRQRAFLGTYRIRLDNIDLPPIPENRLHNISRLKRIFLAQKCLRYDPRNYIQATLSQRVFEQRNTSTDASDGLRELLLAADDNVHCLHGSCRISAAKSVLRGRDRWWTVELYNTDIGK